LGSMACTPAGAFIKKSFVEKYGGFSTDTLTEDFEMGLRIQSKGYQIVQSLDSKVYTVVPNKLKNF
jgi:cellulose synthase (UDP-forming)